MPEDFVGGVDTSEQQDAEETRSTFVQLKKAMAAEYPHASEMDIWLACNWVATAIITAGVPRSYAKPIWVILTAEQGTGKTELLKMMCDLGDVRKNKSGYTYSIGNQTLIKKQGAVTRQSREDKALNGDVNESTAQQYNNKCHVIYEGTTYFPTKSSPSKDEFFASDRDEFDGMTGREGVHASSRIDGLKINKIVMATPNLLLNEDVFNKDGQRYMGIKLEFPNTRALDDKRMDDDGEFDNKFVPEMKEKWHRFFMKEISRIGGYRFDLKPSELLGPEYTEKYQAAQDLAKLLRAKVRKEYRQAVEGRIAKADAGRHIDSIKTMLRVMWNINNGRPVSNKDKEVAIQTILMTIPEDTLRVAKLMTQYKGITVTGAMFHPMTNYAPATREFVTTVLESGLLVEFDRENTKGIFDLKQVKKQEYNEDTQQWQPVFGNNNLVRVYCATDAFRALMFKLFPELEETERREYYFDKTEADQKESFTAQLGETAPPLSNNRFDEEIIDSMLF